ncbi:MAG TPA: VOC family protein [Isosphaeraceae bacterium]|nr:VOC family protein [Isosphaeraceae bacterium]
MPRVVHFEIHATDPDRLVAFYTDLFGWAFQKWEGPMDYWLIQTGPPEERGIDGGLVRRRGAAPAYGQAVNAYACTVDVPSAQDALNRAVGLGGSVAVPLMPIPGVGWLGYATDPDGNLFGVMQRDPAAA